MPRSRKPFGMCLILLVASSLAACNSSPTAQAARTTTTATALPIPATASANQSPEGDAQLACNFYSTFLSLFPTYVHNPVEPFRPLRRGSTKLLLQTAGTPHTTNSRHTSRSSSSKSATPRDGRKMARRLTRNSRRFRRNAGRFSPRVSCADLLPRYRVKALRGSGAVTDQRLRTPYVLQRPNASISKKAPTTASTIGRLHLLLPDLATLGMYQSGTAPNCER